MRFQTTKIEDMKADTIVALCFQDLKQKSDLLNYLIEKSDGELEKQLTLGAFNAGFLETFKLALNPNQKVILMGLGKSSAFTRLKLSQAVSNAFKAAKKVTKNKTIAVELISKPDSEKVDISLDDAANITFNAARIGLYEFNKYLADKSTPVETIELITNVDSPEVEKGSELGAFSSFAIKFAKDLVNESAQIVTPEYVSGLAKEIAKEHKLDFKVYNKSEIKEMGMGAFYAVGQGSVNEPKFIHLTYKPKGTVRKKIALIGKGITFDAGGLDLKTAASMLTMKHDMTGAASVLGIIQAVAKMKSDIELHVISALCENMPSGASYKPGDILTAMNGKTIEVENTDAEGRLTLADALTYADSLDVDEVIDIATLTGAAVVALGKNITPVLGNNQAQIDKFIETAKRVGEATWQMPIFEELKDNLTSVVADMKNTGGRNAGTSTAGWFLSNFTKSKAWLHLDIAGTAWIDSSNKETLVKGPTGVMIKSLVSYLVS